jgi:hypothetical protein
MFFVDHHNAGSGVCSLPVTMNSSCFAAAVCCCCLLLLLLLLQGIKEHPWYTAELPPFLQQALDDLQLEQVRHCDVITHVTTQFRQDAS